MVYKVRVRGIYSTAISKILYDRGLMLVDVSETIAKRLGINSLRGEAADVTIKSDDSDPSNILVIGFPKAVRYVVNMLTSTIPYMITLVPSIGLYSTFKTHVIDKRDGECLVETPVGPAQVVDLNECVKGMELPVTSIKVPLRRGERPLFSSRLRVVGYYAIVGRGSRLTFSNHVRNKNRISELVALSSSYIRRGYSIHWRSNVDEADLNEVLKELSSLVELLNNVEKSVASSKALEVVYEGEAIALLIPSSISKAYLDSVRASIAPTTPYHHQLKGVGGGLSDVVDLLDILSAWVGRDALSRSIKEWLISKLPELEVSFKHLKLDGTTINLGSGKVRAAYLDGGDVCIEVERDVRSRGVYDGIGTHKEVGDKIISKVCENRWWITHTYISPSNIVKGEYININAPPEVLPDRVIKYIDLGVDLVKSSNGACRLIDVGEFRSLIIDGIVREDFINAVLNTLNTLIDSLCVLKSGT